MTTNTIRTRFAPSPTGYLHLGGARTALFSWLFARHFGGVFVLRIEDTDLQRSTEESIQAILDGMQWLGLDYDEGPFYQTKRMDRYTEVLKKLLASGDAYYCNCSKERLEKMREAQMARKEKPRYDGHCRDLNLTAAAGMVIRFKNPQEGDASFDDLIRGKIVVHNSELDDLVIMRSDGTPTYNFSVVVDDADMEITHVVRGDDHINNTPRQINIMRALHATPPAYAHVPMILGADGKRLSKRHGAVSVLQYHDSGYLPEAMLNFLVRLGWSHGDQEIFSREEMVELFNLDAVSRSPAAFNPEKLAWLNQHYFKTLDPAVIAKPFADQLKRLNIDYQQGPALEDVISIQAERSKTLEEMAERSRFFYEDFAQYDAKAAAKNLKADVVDALRDIRHRFQDLNNWEKDILHRVVVEVAEAKDLKLGKVAQPVRVAVTGGTVSPPIDVTLLLIGRARVLQRLDRAIEYIEAQGEKAAATG